MYDLKKKLIIIAFFQYNGRHNADISEYKKNSDWDLIGMPANKTSAALDGSDDNDHDIITHEIKLRRRPLKYLQVC